MTMRKLLYYLFHWFKFRLFCYVKFFRPNNLRIAGKIKIDLKSIIFFDKKSQIFLDNDFNITKSFIHIHNSNFVVGKCSNCKRARIHINDSDAAIGESSNILNVMLSINNHSDFKAEKYFLLSSVPFYKSGLFSNNAKVTIGNNVSIHAHVICENAPFKTGDNVFLNGGSQIRSTHSITMGNNILLSYECIVFDTNTHSLDAKDREQEMIDGFPNEAVQSENSKLKVKRAPIIIGDNVWIGTRAIILKGTTIENEAIIGAATVLSGQTVGFKQKAFGNPAQIR